MEFQASFDDPRILKGIIEAVSSIIKETTLVARPDGIRMNAIDDQRVAMLLAVLNKSLFSEYKCEEEFTMGLNVVDFLKIIKRAKGNDEIHLIRSSDDPNMLHIKMKSSKSTRVFKIKSRDINQGEVDTEGTMEKLEEALEDKFKATITLETALLDEIIKDALIIGEHIKVNVIPSEKTLGFLAYDDTGELEIEIDLEGDGVLEADVTEECEGMYSLPFLESIIKIQSILDLLAISLGSNIPMKVKGNLPDVDGNPGGGVIKYFLAPKIDEGEDDDFDDDFDTESFDDEFLDEDIEI